MFARAIPFAAAFLLLPSLTLTQRLSTDGAAQTFTSVSEQYFHDVYFHFSPTAATAVGFHEFDGQMDDYAATEIAKEAAEIRAALAKVEAIPADALDREVAADREVLMNNMRSRLLSIDTIRMWEKNPDNYSSGVTSSISC